MKAQLLIDFPKTKDKVRGSIPYGYKLVEDGSKALELIPEHIELLARMINDLIDHKVSSLREAKEIIESELEDAAFDPERLHTLTQDLDNQRTERDKLEEEWLRVTLELE